jgi:hypothetical protein
MRGMTTITKPVPVPTPAGMMARVDQLRARTRFEAHPRWLPDSPAAKEKDRVRKVSWR